MKTMHEYRGYVFSVTYAPQDPSYVVDFRDIPEIISSGDTLSEAFANACEALDLHLESLQKLGKRLPKSRHRLVVEATK
ncbi:MAG: type II toxin-antitoxin system HicB family antitoxin [Phycisphaerales bacterium]|nr:type II toxin-antitoxin system HicB family antitoxin [Phycisphaerales bacterium]